MIDIVKILFLCADPDDLARIRLGREISEVEKNIRLGKYRDRFQIFTHFAVKEDDIRPALLMHQPHILHFSGHGSPQDGIILEDANGMAQCLSPQRFARIIATLPDNLRIVFLNACYSGQHTGPISNTVDITIGMNDRVLDDSAIDFSTNFYLGLAFNRNIQRCFDLGVSALVDRGIPQEHIPVLLTRNGIDASNFRLLTLDDTPVVEPQPRSTDATVHLDIVVMPSKLSHMQVWRYATDRDRQTFISLEEMENRLSMEQTWAELAVATNQSANLPGNRRETGADVLLLLRDNFIENLHDERTLDHIVKRAAESSSGGNLYICWEQKTTFPVAYPKFQTVVERWFHLVRASGATDVIELPANIKLDRVEDYKILRRFIRNSEIRRARLRRLVSDGDWGLVLRPKALSIKKFIDRFDDEDLLLDEGSNLAVFYDQRPRRGWMELLNESRRLDRGGNWFIATLARGNLKDKDLTELWLHESKRAGSGSFDGIIEFDGTFEWLYAMLRLKLAVRLARETSPTVAGKALF
ncbi:MAG TPA: CHAT domain-containing protein [Pyrinomonadaceae bacterium]|nr:CHAT domain-containing protein [Pyrinomonadaceae bacterium]